MKAYELIFILDPALSEEAVEAELKVVQDIIAREGGEIVEIQRWGKKRLAYEIKKRKEGYYVLVHLRGGPRLISELDRHFKLSEVTLRHLSVRSKESKKPPLEVKPIEEVAAPA